MSAINATKITLQTVNSKMIASPAHSVNPASILTLIRLVLRTLSLIVKFRLILLTALFVHKVNSQVFLAHLIQI